MGTDAGNPLTLHGPAVYAEMEAMQAAGMSPSDVLVASTRTAALAMGRLEEIGTIEAGKVADLLVDFCVDRGIGKVGDFWMHLKFRGHDRGSEELRG